MVSVLEKALKSVLSSYHSHVDIRECCRIAYSKIITGAGKAIAMPLGSDALAGDINKALAALEADGTVQALRDKWGIKFEI